MAKVTVTIKVYGKAIRSGYVEVISAEKFNEKVTARAKEFYEDEEEFYEWLEDNYTTRDMWNMTGSAKKTVKEVIFKDKCLDWAYDDIGSEYEEFEITTKVDCPCDCRNE
jgi:hypothetical protein